LTDLFIESFIKPLNDWCESNGKTFTAHVKGEEHPLFQTAMNGSCHQIFQNVGLPGIDALERFPTGHFFPRQIASVAAQFGAGNSMVECFGGAGWGATPEDFENYLMWLSGHGINHIVVHLWQYELTTHAMRDWAPSIPNHLNWREVFPPILEKVKKYFVAQPAADLLIIAPYRGIAAEFAADEIIETNIHNAATYPATAAGKLNTKLLELLDRVQGSGANYHLADERTVEEHGRLAGGGLKVGNCIYTRVILAEGAMLNAVCSALIADLIQSEEFEPHRTVTKNTPSDRVKITKNIDWRIKTGLLNELVLESAPLSGSRFVARFQSAENIELELFFLDKVNEVTVNGQSLGGDLRFDCAKGSNEIRFVCDREQKTPFLSARGNFAAQSPSSFGKGANGTVKTPGAFVLHSAGRVDADDLTISGYPFCRESVTVGGTIDLPVGVRKLRFRSVKADCAKVNIAGIDCGWMWGADWTIVLPENLASGQHSIEVEIIPSTFNFFGPHHHVDGDLQVVSPGQYDYVKNFADRADAPENTRIAEWNFKPFGIGSAVEFIESE
jgi:hypothetical protein